MEFWHFFGCGVEIFLTLWLMLVTMSLLPSDDRLEHLLWVLMFLKLYAGQKPLCSLAGGVDPETIHNWSEILLRLLHN